MIIHSDRCDAEDVLRNQQANRLMTLLLDNGVTPFTADIIQLRLSRH
jgi:hypothetical protein